MFATLYRAVPAAALLSLALAAPQSAQAHGSMVQPKSRIVVCNEGNRENPTDPACAAAKAASGSSQLFYDWTGINQAAADGNHQAVVPDGKLCSGNNPTFRGLDLARADWQAQPIVPDVNGRFEFLFRGTAPHATRNWLFYVTKPGWSPTTPLRWGDLEQFCSLGNVPLSADGNYRLQCSLPQRTGRHMIYNVWQRSDSQEAFYTCMDVQFTGGTATPPTTPPTTPPVTPPVTPPTAAWVDAGAVTANNALPVGTRLALRVFHADGSDAERVEITLQAGQTAAVAWPAQLARQVNAQSRFARIGVLSNGTVTPVAAARGNRVYLNDAARKFAIDTRLPETMPPTTPPGPVSGGRYDFIYPSGIGKYVPGQTVVQGSDRKLYQCRPFPHGAWCNIKADAYTPGTGWAWQDAWSPL